MLPAFEALALNALGGIPVVGAAVAGAAAFIGSCRVCLIALAVLALATAAELHGRHIANQNCRADKLQAEVAAAQRDRDIADAAARDAQAAERKLAEQSADLQKKVESYEKTLADVGRVCRLTDDDIKRLRELR